MIREWHIIASSLQVIVMLALLVLTILRLPLHDDQIEGMTAPIDGSVPPLHP